MIFVIVLEFLISIFLYLDRVQIQYWLKNDRIYLEEIEIILFQSMEMFAASSSNVLESSNEINSLRKQYLKCPMCADGLVLFVVR